MSELDDLLGQVARLGIPGHVHDRLPAGDGDPESCNAAEMCISEEEAFSSLVKAPAHNGVVHVDTMTAFALLSDLPDGAGFDAAWAELVDIDRGE